MNEKGNVGKPLFENVFGENNTIKVLDFLFMGDDFDFTLTHIHKGTGLSRTAVRNAIVALLKSELVEKSREDDKSKYYKVNKKSNKYKVLQNLYKQIMSDVISSWTIFL